MRYPFGSIFIALFITGAVYSFSYCEELEMGQLVDQFKQATDVQRGELRDSCNGKEILGYGTVENVREYNTFDEVNDIERNYYEIITGLQKTPKGNPYKVIFLYKNLDKIKDIDKGQTIERRAGILRVIDDRLWISVWLYEGDLRPKRRPSSSINKRENCKEKGMRGVM